MLKVFDNFSKKKKFLRFKNKEVKIYLCGPTVYDHVHIGNIRGIIILDVLNRLLRKKRYKINFVNNITDIDDKIINRAKIKGKKEKEISEFYFEEYKKVLLKLNLIKYPIFLKVTDYIPQISNFIKILFLKEKIFFDEKKGFVFYKDSFTVWKKTTTGKCWSLPLKNINGRPGWHLECAALIDTFFKSQTLDFHAGGMELKFPHHENEQLLFFAKNQQPLAKIWIHFGKIVFAGKKMSKSKGNCVYLFQFLKNYDVNVLRYCFLNSNYRKPINFSFFLAKQAKNFFNKIFIFLKQINFYLFEKENLFQIRSNFLIFKKKVEKEKSFFVIKKYKELIINLENNLNTSKSLDIFKEIFIESKDFFLTLTSNNNNKKNKENIFFLKIIFLYFKKIFNLFGFTFFLKNFNKKTKILIKKWKISISNKDYKTADNIRRVLIKQNVL